MFKQMKDNAKLIANVLQSEFSNLQVSLATEARMKVTKRNFNSYFCETCKEKNFNDV